MKEVEIALEVDAVATSELNVEVPYHHGVRYPVNSVSDPCHFGVDPDPQIHASN
jgi:hypothetical protein